MHPRWLIALVLCLLPLPFAAGALPKSVPHHMPLTRPLRTHLKLTRADRQYLVALQTNSSYFSDDLYEYQLLTSHPRLTSPIWTRKMAVVLSAMHLLAARGRVLQAPPRYLPAQQTYRLAMAQYDLVCQTMPGAIVHRNKAAMNRCTGFLSAAGRYSRQAAQQVAAASR